MGGMLLGAGAGGICRKSRASKRDADTGNLSLKFSMYPTMRNGGMRYADLTENSLRGVVVQALIGVC
jgi:hypothetical protein